MILSIIILIIVLVIGSIIISSGFITNQEIIQISEISTQYEHLEKYKNELERINQYNLQILDGASDGWGGTWLGLKQGDWVSPQYQIGPNDGNSMSFPVQLNVYQPVYAYVFTTQQSILSISQIAFNLTGPDWLEFGSDGILGLELNSLLPFFGLLITLASAYRLAVFNIATNQSDSFIGLPTPANTLLILSLPLIMEFQNNDTMNTIILNKWFLIAVTLVSCYLLNANIKLLALKFKNWGFKNNAARYILIILAAVLLIVFRFAAIPLIIITYIIISLLNK